VVELVVLLVRGQCARDERAAEYVTLRIMSSELHGLCLSQKLDLDASTSDE